MNEKEIELYLKRQTEKLGGLAYKFVSPGNAGAPDRMVLLPGGRIGFVELKAAGKKSRPIQRAQQRRISSRGFSVFADVDSLEKVDEALRRIQGVME